MATNLLKNIDAALELYWKVTWRRNQQLIEKTVEKLKKVKERLQDPAVKNNITNRAIEQRRNEWFPSGDKEKYPWVLPINEDYWPMEERWSWWSNPGNSNSYWTYRLENWWWLANYYNDNDDGKWYWKYIDKDNLSALNHRMYWPKSSWYMYPLKNPLNWKWEWVYWPDIWNYLTSKNNKISPYSERDSDDKIVDKEWFEEFNKDLAAWKYALTGNVYDWFQFVENPRVETKNLWLRDADGKLSPFFPWADVQVASSVSYPYWKYIETWTWWRERTDKELKNLWNQEVTKDYYWKPLNQRYYHWREYNEYDPAQVEYWNHLIEKTWLTPADVWLGKTANDTMIVWWPTKRVTIEDYNKMSQAEKDALYDNYKDYYWTWRAPVDEWTDYVPDFVKRGRWN